MWENPNQADGPLVDGGFIIHDAARDRVHDLNHVAALVLTFCNGQSIVAEDPLLLQRQFDLDRLGQDRVEPAGPPGPA